MKEKIEYYATLVKPFKDKYGIVTPITREFRVSNKKSESIRSFYSQYGKEARWDCLKTNGVFMGYTIERANYPEDFTELDYVLKHKEIIVQYGNGGAEFKSVPCKLFKRIIRTEEEIVEL